VFLASAFSFLVAIFWLGRFRKMDKYEREPERLIFLSFLAGMVATVPSVLLESPLHSSLRSGVSSVSGLFLSFLWVGMVEEFFKYLAVRLTVYRSKEFNEVMDGPIYMISAALGFAATENVGYMLGFGLYVGFIRAIFSYLGHVSFSAILGYYMGRARIEGRRDHLYIGFILAVSFHTFYDGFFVLGTARDSGHFIFLGLAVWASALALALILMKKAQAVSPFRTAHILPKRLTRLCQMCGKTISSRAWICHHCGEPLTLDEEDITLKA
jgi:RsiW-degrading membrane proteinase PrsW (M82 family)